ncbi:hypothetical protein [Spirosoma flavum]|uniref:Uncharacterized protein n=1 Tax=Spirosoma flavum TaxID=2048557 RepID=A0ABW6AIB8_9BACT
MKLALTPLEIPFKIGDTVWVNQPFGATNQCPYFQGMIMQIILDGSLSSTIVIRQRVETHEVIISGAIYGIKPSGEHAGSPRININVQLIPLQKSLFETKEELLAYQKREGEQTH